VKKELRKNLQNIKPFLVSLCHFLSTQFQKRKKKKEKEKKENNP